MQVLEYLVYILYFQITNIQIFLFTKVTSKIKNILWPYKYICFAGVCSNTPYTCSVYTGIPLHTVQSVPFRAMPLHSSSCAYPLLYCTP